MVAHRRLPVLLRLVLRSESTEDGPVIQLARLLQDVSTDVRPRGPHQTPDLFAGVIGQAMENGPGPEGGPAEAPCINDPKTMGCELLGVGYGSRPRISSPAW